MVSSFSVWVTQSLTYCPTFWDHRNCPDRLERNAEVQNDVIFKYLSKYRRKPLFLFVHYYDVHSDFMILPYDSPAPFTNMFYKDYSGTFSGGFGDKLATDYLVYVNHNRIQLRKDDLKYIASLYDSGIAYVDKCIGDLFERLKELNLYDNSLIILTADHGEEFQEHGFMLHGSNLFYEQTLRVPLVVKLPGDDIKPVQISNLVESIDIMPSILNFLRIDNSSAYMQGSSFIRLIKGAQEWKDAIFAFGRYGEAFIRTSRWKLITDSLSREAGFKLFDLQTDQLENDNVIEKFPQIMREMKLRLLEKYSEIVNAADRKRNLLTDAEKAKLKSLGYVH